MNVADITDEDLSLAVCVRLGIEPREIQIYNPSGIRVGTFGGAWRRGPDGPVGDKSLAAAREHHERNGYTVKPLYPAVSSDDALAMSLVVPLLRQRSVTVGITLRAEDAIAPGCLVSLQDGEPFGKTATTKTPSFARSLCEAVVELLGLPGERDGG